MFIQVILAGVRNYSYLDLLQKPSLTIKFFSDWLNIA